MPTRQGVLLAVLVLVGAGVAAAQGDLTVDGLVESATGFKFPDGSVQTSAATAGSYAQVVVVAKADGDFSTIQAAIDSITDAAADKRYLVWVGAGDYDEQVTMKQYVDVQGAGREVTRIVQGASGATPVVTAASAAALRDLTVRCLRTNLDCTGVLNSGTAMFSVDNVWIYVDSGSSGTAGTTRGLANDGSAVVTVTRTRVEALGGDDNGAIYNTNSTGASKFVTLRHVEAIADSNAGLARAGSNCAVFNQNTQLSAFDLTAEAREGANDTAVEVDDSTVELRQLFADASLGTTEVGLEVRDDSIVQLRNSRIRALSGDPSGSEFGILAQGSSPTQTLFAYNSQIDAVDFTVLTVAGSDFSFQGCHFDGGAVTGAGTETCRFSTDESFTAFSNTCP